MSADEYFHEDMIMELSEEEHASTQRLLKSSASQSRSSLQHSTPNRRTFGGALQSPSNYDSNSDGERGYAVSHHQKKGKERDSNSPNVKNVSQLKQQIRRENNKNKNLLAKVMELEKDLTADDDWNDSLRSKPTRNKGPIQNKEKKPQQAAKKPAIQSPKTRTKEVTKVRHLTYPEQKAIEQKLFQNIEDEGSSFERNPSLGRKTPMRYGQMSEEEASHAFESRKRELYSELLQSVRNKKRGNSPGPLPSGEKPSPRIPAGTPQRKAEKTFVVFSNKQEPPNSRPKTAFEAERTPSTRKAAAPQGQRMTPKAKTFQKGSSEAIESPANYRVASGKRGNIPQSRSPKKVEDQRKKAVSPRRTETAKRGGATYQPNSNGNSPGAGIGSPDLRNFEWQKNRSVELSPKRNLVDGYEYPQDSKSKPKAGNSHPNILVGFRRSCEQETPKNAPGGSYVSLWRKKFQNKGEYLFEKGVNFKQQTLSSHLL